MTLTELINRAGVVPDAVAGEAAFEHMMLDSRQVMPGSLFVCMPGYNLDSHAFLQPAYERGATAAIVHSDLGMRLAAKLGIAAALVRTEGWRFHEFIASLSKTFHNNPSLSMRVVGVTGTNGKTTTAWIMADALRAMNRKVAYLGTLGMKTPSGSVELHNTTPVAVELADLLSRAKADGTEDLVMEVSSHSLEERRADVAEFDAAVFTNLTQDHLDFHKTMKNYGDAKRRLFSDLPRQSAKKFTGALNVDDETGRRWAQDLSCERFTYGLEGGNLRGEALDVGIAHLVLRLTWQGESCELKMDLGGRFNVANAMSAAAGLVALGYSLDEVCNGLSTATPVPGRFEAVPNDRGIGVIVDYAHTPDALQKLLDAAKELPHIRLIVVFGCGGDRDSTKRPAMAKVVSERADITVVTSDNPRTEDPQQILRQMRVGIKPGAFVVEIPDRASAITEAMRMAEPGDIVVIAGKGHENYQIIGHEKLPMDDRLLAKEALAR